MVNSGLLVIQRERLRQITKKGFTLLHDKQHDCGELAMAAACYAAPEMLYALRATAFDGLKYVDPWPWGQKWDKRERHDRVKQLAVAGALIAAEIDRLVQQQDRNSFLAEEAAFFAASIAFAGWFSGGDVPVKLALITWGAVFAGQVMGQFVDSSGLTLAHYGALKSITIVGGAGLLFGLAVYQAAAWIGF